MDFLRVKAVATLASSMAIAVLSACLPSPPSVKTCHLDADCGSGIACKEGLCQADIAVTVVSPAGAVFTNSTVQILIEVAGATPAQVELRVDEIELAKVAPPYGFAWDTRLVAEGLHKLWARVVVGQRVYESAQVDVTVDRTAPTVAALVPAPGAGNVWSRDPITVTFSEPIEAPPEQAISIASADGAAIAKTLKLSAERHTLTIVPASLPAVPNTLSVTLTDGIRDLAGNSLVVPAGRWSWTILEWQEVAPSFAKSLGGSLFSATAIGPDGSVYTALQDNYAAGSSPDVRRAAGGAWTSLGLVVRDGQYHGWGCALAVDSQGRPVVAFRDGSSSSYQLYVSRYDGSSWIPLGDSLNASATSSAGPPRMVFDSADLPIVAWSQAVGNVHHLFVKKWNGSSWVGLGGETPTTSTSDVTVHDLAMNADGALSMAYIENGTTLRLVRFDGTSWREPGNANGATTTEIALAFDHSGVEVATYVESGAVKVARWASAFSGFVPLGTPLSSSASHTSIVFRPNGAAGQQLVVAFTESNPNGPRVLGWNGSAWVSMATSIATPSNSMYQPTGPTLTVNSSSVLSYAWGVVEGPFTPRLFFGRFNR